MHDKEINNDKQENATSKADDFDKEKEITVESNNKSSANNKDENDEVMKEQKETD